jgi:hypothetical protein
MDDIERFVIDGNVSRFVGMLRDETNPSRQDMLRRLLIAEEKRFGRASDCLESLERHLTDGEAIIARQRGLIAEMKGNGGDVGSAERTLQRYESIQDVLHSLHFARS